MAMKVFIIFVGAFLDVYSLLRNPKNRGFYSYFLRSYFYILRRNMVLMLVVDGIFYLSCM